MDVERVELVEEESAIEEVSTHTGAAESPPFFP